jgi:hypothetical protein
LRGDVLAVEAKMRNTLDDPFVDGVSHRVLKSNSAHPATLEMRYILFGGSTKEGL